MENKMGKSVRVLIVDDHDMVRRGLSLYLDTLGEFELIGEASNGRQALELAGELKPDVILMDLVMPEMDGIQATRELLKMNSNFRVIALTSFQDENMVQSALEAGAISYLQKNVSVTELGEAIRKAVYGLRTLSPEATQALISLATRPAEPDYDLTPREKEILVKMVDGLTNPEIAQVLGISPSTVKSHVSSILSKLGATSRTEAVSIAIQNNLHS
jgi:two-component system, NarL family, response regulator LiaR